MRSRRIKFTAVVLLLVVVAVASACGGAEQPAIDGETLLEERCSECHSLTRVTNQEMTRAEWEQTVTRMVEMGAQLSDEEKTVLVDYLAENYGP